MLLFNELEIETVVPERDHELESDLRKSLPKTDARATQERREGERLALLTRGCLVPFAVSVESFRHELFRLPPLPRIPVDVLNHDVKGVAGVHVDTADADIFVDARGGRRLGRCAEPHAFLVALLHVLELLDVFEVHFAHDVIFDTFHERVGLLVQLLVVFWVENERCDQI